MGENNFSFSNFYFKPVDASDEEYKELKVQGLELCTIEFADKPRINEIKNVIFEEPSERTFNIIDKAFIKMKQVKSKRLKKKYYKRTIIYRLIEQKS